MQQLLSRVVAICLVGASPLVEGQVRITEFQYSGVNGEFIELSNTGASAVDLNGWSIDDDSNTPGSFAIGALGTLAPGESAVITESVATDFRAAWNLCAAAKVIGANGQNLGRNDTINLYDAQGAQADTLRYGDQTFPGSIRTQNIAGWVSAAGLGADNIAQWTLASIGDAEQSRSSSGGDIGSPGLSHRAGAPFDPCQALGPRMRITEYMYDGPDGEFVEFTNVGDAAADLAGWSFDDDSNIAGSESLAGFASVQPGESVVFTASSAAAFRSAWQLCAGVKVIGGNASGLGRNDQINLYDGAGQRVDRLSYGDETTAGSIRAKDRSGWVGAGAVGADQILGWTLSSSGDGEDSRTSQGGATGSPGRSQRALFDFDPCVGVAGAPSVTVDVAATTRRLDLPVNAGGAVAGTLGDATDPAATEGIVLQLADSDGDVGLLDVSVSSGNLAVVAASGLSLQGSGATRTLRIVPSGSGYAAISVRAVDADAKIGSYVIHYAAAAAAAGFRHHTGSSDASAAIVLDPATLLVADDENQVLRRYRADASGLPDDGFDLGPALALTDLDGGQPREVDLEGAARADDVAFWTGSHSNKKDNGAARPNRQRVFATRIVGSGDSVSLSYIGRYDHLRSDLLAWDSSNGHGLGANALGLTASAAIGIAPERVDGFNIEGLALAPSADGLLLAFRAPLLPTSARHDALLIHAQNLRSVILGAPAQGSAAAGSLSFAAPIRLDLGGRGIRDIVRNRLGQYLIVAGPTGEASGTPPSDFRLFLWSGNPADSAQPLVADLSAISAEGSIETLANADRLSGNGSMLHLLSDSGERVWYGDGIIAKDLAEPRLRRFVGGRVAVDIPLPADVLFRDDFDRPAGR